MNTKEQKNNSKLKQATLMASRLILTFVIVFIVGFIGIKHYRNVSNANKKNSAINKKFFSDDMVESVSYSQNPSREIMKINGFKFDINRELVKEDLNSFKNKLDKRKRLQGWKEMKKVDKNLVEYVNKINALQDFKFYVNNNEKMEAYNFEQNGDGTAVTTVAFDMKPIQDRIKNNTVNNTYRDSSDIPMEYRALMPVDPNIELRKLNSQGSDLYVCTLEYGNIEMVSAEVRKDLDSEGWRQEGWEKIIEEENLLNKGKMITAVKNNKLCNIMVSRDDNKILIAYRFSKLTKLRR